MLLTLIIVGGVVATTLIACVFDYLGKKAKGVDPRFATRLADLERRQGALEATLLVKDEKITELTKEITFVSKLLDKGDKNEQL